MYNVNLSSYEQKTISRAAEIEILYLMDMAQNKKAINRVSDILRHPESKIPPTKFLDTEVSLTVQELLEVFEKVQNDPQHLFSIDVRLIDLITIILCEHFEDEWANEHDDNVEFEALCYKVIHLTELIEINQSNLN
jgi:hypothetical protein